MIIKKVGNIYKRDYVREFEDWFYSVGIGVVLTLDILVAVLIFRG